MSELETIRIRKEKEALEAEITALIQSFEKRSGLEISLIHIVKAQGYGTSNMLIGIKTTVEL